MSVSRAWLSFLVVFMGTFTFWLLVGSTQFEASVLAGVVLGLIFGLLSFGLAYLFWYVIGIINLSSNWINSKWQVAPFTLVSMIWLVIGWIESNPQRRFADSFFPPQDAGLEVIEDSGRSLGFDGNYWFFTCRTSSNYLAPYLAERGYMQVTDFEEEDERTLRRWLKTDAQVEWQLEGDYAVFLLKAPAKLPRWAFIEERGDTAHFLIGISLNNR